MSVIWGRDLELKSMKSLLEKDSASLMVIMGRRRIGKSSLAKAYANNFKHFFSFDGLPPVKGQTNQEQLDHFAFQFSEQFHLPKVKFTDWSEAFTQLDNQIHTGRTLILLDEISWSGMHDINFPGKLKSIWDNKFSQKKNVVLILCGSVSSWIKKNILDKTDFVGRVSLQLLLKELPLSSIKKFWKGRDVSTLDLAKILSVTGCIPKYLEEVRKNVSPEAEIQRLCFQDDGFLFNEFQKIFKDIFRTRSKSMYKIIETLAEKKMAPNNIGRLLGKTQNSELTEDLDTLEIAGFIRRDFNYKPDLQISKLSQYRLSDNYLRFYVKYLAKNSNLIKNSNYKINSLSQLTKWDTILGLQFENLILNHIDEVIPLLDVSSDTIVSASPHFQTKKAKNKGGCQIDLLIQTKISTWYICEIKIRNRIDREVIKEVKNKIRVLEKPKYTSLRPVLIYQGELTDEEACREYFTKLIPFEELLK